MDAMIHRQNNQDPVVGKGSRGRRGAAKAEEKGSAETDSLVRWSLRRTFQDDSIKVSEFGH